MPETICTTVYRFDELSDGAKEKARDWYRALGPHDERWDAVYGISGASARSSASRSRRRRSA